MTGQELVAWGALMHSARGQWIEDPVRNGERALYFCASRSDATRGVFVAVDEHSITGGIFEEAIPHIGDALFRNVWTLPARDPNDDSGRDARTMIDATRLEPLSRVIFADAINRYSNGGHPVATKHNVDRFSLAFALDCLATALRSGAFSPVGRAIAARAISEAMRCDRICNARCTETETQSSAWRRCTLSASHAGAHHFGTWVCS